MNSKLKTKYAPVGSIFLLRAELVRVLRRKAAAFDRLARATRSKLLTGQIHDLRVLTRRLRASLWLARHMASRAHLRIANRDLKALGRALGARRLFDVALRDAAKYGLPGAGLRPRRAAAGAEVARRLAPSRCAALVARLRRVGDAVAEAADDRMAAGLLQRAQRLGLARTRARRGRAAMHRLRIEAKKTRYLLEFLGRKTRGLRTLQRSLGRAHDLEVLQELLGRQERVARDEVRAWAGARQRIAPALQEARRELAAAAGQFQVR